MTEICECGCSGVFVDGIWIHIDTPWGNRAEQDHGFVIADMEEVA